MAETEFSLLPVNSSSAPTDFRAVAGLQYAAGMFCILVGTLSAILLLPEDYYEPGQLRLSAIVMALGLLSGPLLSSLQDSRVWIRAESVMMVGLIYWLLVEPLRPDYVAYQLSRAGIVKAFVLIGVFACLIQLGSKIAHATQGTLSPVSSAARDFSREWLYVALLTAAGLGLLARLIPCGFSPMCMADGLFSARAEGVWVRSTGGSGAFVSHLAYFGYLTLPLTIALHHRTGRVDWRVVLGGVLTTLILLYLIRDGGRRIVGMVLGAGFMTWLLLQPRLGLRQIILAAVAGFALLALLQIMFFFRLKEGGIVSGLFSGTALNFNPLEDGLHVDNNFHYLVRTLDLIPEFKSHTGWEAILYWAVRPIPRVFWPDKPMTPGIWLPYEFDEMWSAGFTITTSAIGDWYIAFGVWSVAIAALLMGYFGGKLVLAWLGPTVRQKLLYSLGLMWLFIGLRNYLELMLMSYPILALYLLDRLSARREIQTVAEPVPLEARP